MKTISIFILSLLFSTTVYSYGARTVCDTIDDRVHSFDPAIARLRTSLDDLDSSCSATLIGKNCMITAGHCYSFIRFVEFNTKLSLPNKDLVRSNAEDIFLADRSSIKTGRSYYPGEDWAVFRVIPNRGERNLEEGRGAYSVSYLKPEIGEELSITGYGRDDGESNRVQQRAFGEITKLVEKRLYYRIDTTSGNSGSSVINMKNEVVGIHTQGGCSDSRYSANNGTLIHGNAPLVEAIRNCLQYSKNDKSLLSTSNF